MTLSVLYERKTASSQHVITSTLIQSLTSLVLVVPLAALLEPMHVVWAPTLFLSLGYLVIGNSVIAIVPFSFSSGTGKPRTSPRCFFSFHPVPPRPQRCWSADPCPH